MYNMQHWAHLVLALLVPGLIALRLFVHSVLSYCFIEYWIMTKASCCRGSFLRLSGFSTLEYITTTKTTAATTLATSTATTTTRVRSVIIENICAPRRCISKECEKCHVDESGGRCARTKPCFEANAQPCLQCRSCALASHTQAIELPETSWNYWREGHGLEGVMKGVFVRCQ